MPISLEVTKGPYAGQSFHFDAHSTFLVGRDRQAQLSLPEDAYFSRRHFLLEINPPLCRLIDLGSKNGTLVNGVRIMQADLRDGDQIQAGTTCIRLRVIPEEKETLLAPSTLTPVLAADDATCVGPTIPGFTIESRIGEGAMGMVYLARRGDGELVALKTLRSTTGIALETLQRFEREANVMQQLDHAHIVKLLAVGQVGRTLWIAMEYIDGLNAAELVERDGPLPPDRAVRLIRQLLDALAHAHTLGFVHRDIKPSNLMIHHPGEPDEALKLTDFGLARTYQDSNLSGLTLLGSHGGTPAFMPPEQVFDFRLARPPADQYSAAATMYFLLTGKPIRPLRGPLHELLQRILSEDVPPLREPPPAGIPAGVWAVLARALDREPERRFPSVEAMRGALDGLSMVDREGR